MITEKVWGTSELLLRSSFVEIHRLSILPHSFCSLHTHNYKWNGFLVVSGTLIIEEEFAESGAESEETKAKIILYPGAWKTVGPGIFHRFSTRELPTLALEFYYPEPLSEDIYRRDLGGRNLVD